MILHFNGMPGTGKRTVAQIVCQRLGARLVDNHSIINPILQTHSHGGPGYQRAVLQETGRLLELHRQETLVFTNALAAERPEDRARLDQIAEHARQHGRAFWQILLHCEMAENQRRILSPQRAQHQKLMDPNILEQLHRDYTIYHPPAEHPLALDTSGLSPDQAAEQILLQIVY